MKQNITILGSTGSIGTNTLDVLSNHLDRFQVFALTASKQVDLILAQCAKFKPKFAVMAQEDAGATHQGRRLAGGGAVGA
jgi:1-deoxy-D-xylulose-5-phosphate reductoisomerase